MFNEVNDIFEGKAELIVPKMYDDDHTFYKYPDGDLKFVTRTNELGGGSQVITSIKQLGIKSLDDSFETIPAAVSINRW